MILLLVHYPSYNRSRFPQTHTCTHTHTQTYMKTNAHILYAKTQDILYNSFPQFGNKYLCNTHTYTYIHTNLQSYSTNTYIVDTHAHTVVHVYVSIHACLLYKCLYAYTQLYTGSRKSLNRSFFSPIQFYVADWMEHPNMSECAREPNTGNKSDVSQDCQCQICHRNHIAKRRGELTHEIVHNASIITVCHSIDCDNVAVIYKACILYWSAVLGRWAMLCSSEVIWVLARHCAAVTHVGLMLQ